MGGIPLQCEGVPIPQLPEPKANGRKARYDLPKNRYALRHGLKSANAPSDCQHVQDARNAFKRRLEEVVYEQKGRYPTLTEAAAINSCGEWLRHSLLAANWLRKHSAKMNHTERILYSKEIARGCSERDKCLRELKLDEDIDKPLTLAAYVSEAVVEPMEDVSGALPNRGTTR